MLEFGGKTEGKTMPLYLTRFSYTPATWTRLIGHPEDRRNAAQSYIESVGGKLHGFWYAFGAHDAYTLWEAPDNVSMAAVALAITGGGRAQLAGNHRSSDRRRNAGCPAEGQGDSVSTARRLARRSLRRRAMARCRTKLGEAE